jgi:hypothetical protein
MKNQLLLLFLSLLSIPFIGQVQIAHYDLIEQAHKQMLAAQGSYQGRALSKNFSRQSADCTLDSLYIYVNKVPVNRTYYSYDSEGNQTGIYTEVWQETQWIPDYQATLTYNDENQLLTSSDQYWGNSEWNPLSNIIYTYIFTGEVESTLGQFWGDGDWEDNYQILSTYDSEDLLSIELFQLWQLDQWQDASRSVYTYDEQGRLSELLLQPWIENDWQNESIQLYQYDSQDQLILEQFNYWTGSDWGPLGLSNYSYDTDGNQIEHIASYWDEDLWQENFRQVYEYDEFQNLTAIMNYSWLNGSWVGPVNVYEYYYTCSDVAVSELNSNSALTIYPNPSAGIVSFQLPYATLVRVFDVNGKMVQQERTQANSITTLHLPAAKGMYLIQTIDDFGNVNSNRVLKH